MNVIATDETTALSSLLKELRSESDDYLKGMISVPEFLPLRLRIDRFCFIKESAYFRRLVTDLRGKSTRCDNLCETINPQIRAYAASFMAANHRAIPNRKVLEALYFFREEGKVRMFGSELISLLRADGNHLKKEKYLLEELWTTISDHDGIFDQLREDPKKWFAKLLKQYELVDDALGTWQLDRFQYFCDEKRRLLQILNSILQFSYQKVGFDKDENYIIIGITADKFKSLHDNKMTLLNKLQKNVEATLKEAQKNTIPPVPIKCQ
jgi:hypothetical protein